MEPSFSYRRGLHLSGYRTTPLRSLVLLCVIVMALVGFAPAFTHSANTALAAPAQVSAADVGPYLGHYSPNTFIELRGGELWFIRPPYESQLLPAGNGIYHFSAGWLTGKAMHFAPNEAGGTSIMLLSDDGHWHEFARSGEIYQDFDPALRGALAEILNSTIAHNAEVPGAALYVHIPGYGMWMGARGVANLGRGIPMVPHDRFHAASVSKMFIATVILQLAQEGVLSLDDTVQQWMPDLVPNGEHITLRHLLNHTSGISNYLEGGFVDAFMADQQRVWSQQELVTYAVSRPPYFAPGEPGRWRYSNTNYVLLGMVIEHATGTSPAQQVRWRIIEPLGLHNTFFEPYELAEGHKARGYVGSQDMSNINMSIVWSAGGVVSTTEDLGRFTQALFSGQLLTPESMAEMHGFVGVDGSWGSQHLVYGLGMMQDMMGIAPGPDGAPRPHVYALVRGHSGALIGYRTATWYLPETGITIVASVNQMHYDPNKIVTEAMNTVLAHTGR